MKLIGLLLLVGFAASVPTPSTDKTIYVTAKSFPDKSKIYTSEHDIVNLMVPINELNFSENHFKVTFLFFVQGDYKKDGTFDNKGLFVLNVETGEATKLLDNGVDFTAAWGDTKDVFFAATDGIYLYNAEKKSAEKYGSVTDSIISIAKANNEDIIYALTADKELFEVAENGEKKVKIDEVKNAQQIVLDGYDNLFFYDSEKHVYVVSQGKIKKIDGLPENPNKITLLRELTTIEATIPVIIDDKVYAVFANDTAKKRPIELTVMPTAYAPEVTFIQFYAYNKSIYNYNIMSMSKSHEDVPNELENYLDDKKYYIESAKRSKRLKLGSKAH